MKTADVTKAVLAATVLLLVAYDISVATNTVTGDTISEVIAGWSWRCQTVPFAAGVLVGHLFWPAGYARKAAASSRRLPWLLFLTADVAIADWFWVGSMLPMWPLVVGFITGHLLWAQPPRR